MFQQQCTGVALLGLSQQRMRTLEVRRIFRCHVIPANTKEEMGRQVQTPDVFPFFQRQRETVRKRCDERRGAIEGPDLFDFPAGLLAISFKLRLGKMTDVLIPSEIRDQLETIETPFNHRPQTVVVRRRHKKMGVGFGQFLEERKNFDHLLGIKVFEDFDRINPVEGFQAEQFFKLPENEFQIVTGE